MAVGSTLTQPAVHRDVTKRAHPEALRPFLPEISAFARHNHFNVLHPIMRYVFPFFLPSVVFIYHVRLVALGLELPEETFVNNHTFDAEGDTWIRFMK